MSNFNKTSAMRDVSTNAANVNQRTVTPLTPAAAANGWLKPRYVVSGINLKALFGEFLCMLLFVFVGCGTAVTFSSHPDFDNNNNSLKLVNYSWGLTTALAFGLAITTLIYSTAHTNSGQINPIVTLALVITADLSILQGLLNIIFSFLGGLLGAGLLYGTLPDHARGTLASNAIQPGVSIGNAFLGEMVCSFFLIYVVLEVVSKNNRSIAGVNSPLVVGLVVFLSHCVLIPLTTCGINPTRSLVTSIVSGYWDKNFWVFIAAPLTGMLIAIPAHFGISYRNIKKIDAFKSHPDNALLGSKPFYNRGALKGSATGDIHNTHNQTELGYIGSQVPSTQNSYNEPYLGFISSAPIYKRR